eukprot:7305685-Pyramimonas_sp.AAC.1
MVRARGAADGGDTARHQGLHTDPLRRRVEGIEALRASGTFHPFSGGLVCSGEGVGLGQPRRAGPTAPAG